MLGNFPQPIDEATMPVDMRKSFDGLAALVKKALKKIRLMEPFSCSSAAVPTGLKFLTGTETVTPSGTSVLKLGKGSYTMNHQKRQNCFLQSRLFLNDQ